MTQVNVLEAKSNLSKLLQMLENRQEDYIMIARNGKPVAKLVRIEKPVLAKRFGAAKGKLNCADDFDWCNQQITDMFEGGGSL